jgi:hypothetical protein
MQIEQTQLDAQVKESMARAELAHSRAVADQGLGLERLSRIQENKALAVERVAAAKKDEDTATLNLIKAIKELEGMDVMHIEKMLTLIERVKQQDELQNQVQKQQVQNTGQPL